MAVELGTRYPILQGPMTRVSDVAPFAEAVAREGGLPFVALAMLRGPEVRAPARRDGGATGRPALGRGRPRFRLARAPRRAARGRRRGPAAVGPDRRRPARPGRRARAPGRSARSCTSPRRDCSSNTCATAAGGSCSKAASAAGTSGRGRASCSGSRPPPWSPTPSIAASRPARSAWSSPAASTMPGPPRWSPGWPARCRRAGSRSACSPAPRTSSPARPSRPARSSADSSRRPSAAARRCCSNPGRVTRCASSPSPFVARFVEERRRLIAEGRPAEEVREALEGLNIGRLRVAAKGVERVNGEGSLLAPVDDSHQQANGLYMLGQAATLRNATTTIAQLHREIADGGTTHLDREIATVDAVEDEGRPSAFRYRDHRHVVGVPRRGRPDAILVEHATRGRRDHRDPAGPLGLAAVL